MVAALEIATLGPISPHPPDSGSLHISRELGISILRGLPNFVILQAAKLRMILHVLGVAKAAGVFVY